MLLRKLGVVDSNICPFCNLSKEEIDSDRTYDIYSVVVQSHQIFGMILSGIGIVTQKKLFSYL